MGERNRNKAIESRAVGYDTLEQWAREKIQAQLQHLLEEEVTTFLGRAPYARRDAVPSVDPPAGSRNGYGKSRQFTMMNGTITVRRPRVRDLTDRFESKVLPLFMRRTRQVLSLGVGSCIVHDGNDSVCSALTAQLRHDCQPVFSSLRRTFGPDFDVTPRLRYDLRRQFLSFPHNLPSVRTV